MINNVVGSLTVPLSQADLASVYFACYNCINSDIRGFPFRNFSAFL